MIYPYYTLGHLIHERQDLVRVPAFLTFQMGLYVIGVSYDILLDHYVAFDLNEAIELDYLHQLKLSDDYLYGRSYVLQTLSYNQMVTLSDDHFARDLDQFLRSLEAASSIPVANA